MNVLITDNNDTSCKLLRALLEAESHAVIVAADGQEALGLLEDHPVDAIISDLLTPNLDGYRLCRAIRQDKRWRDIPFICYTAVNGTLNHEKLAFELGADAYLRKPSSGATILGALRASIDRARNGQNRPPALHAELDVSNNGNQPTVAKLESENVKLREQSRWAEIFRQLVENNSDVFWMIDLSKREILYVSANYETVWGRTCKSLQAEPDSFFDAIHAEDRPRVLDILQAESGLPYELEYRIVRPDYSVRWIRERAFPVREANGLVTRIAAVAEDVTEKRQAEMQLHQSQKMQAVGRLAGGVAHDFNNLLSIIFGHSALLAASSPSEERLRDSVAEINRAAERAAALTRKLLAFGRRQVVEPKALDLNSILAESRKLLRRLIGEEVVLTMNLSSGLNCVNIDPGQIDQLLMNLALNAREAMPQGGELTIETRDVEFDAASGRLHPEAPHGRYVLLAFTDNGCGMTAEAQTRIFEPFFSSKAESTGLGLSVVDGIVKQNGGHVTVASDPGLGATFGIYLPAVEEPRRELSQKARSKPRAGDEIILLVEDEDPVREITTLLLESLGYRVLPVCGAEEALELVQTDEVKIDLLLTDVLMPGMSGGELAEAVRAYDPHLKVLFQSGHTDDVVVRNGILNAEVAFLQKPFSIDALGKKIREIFDRK
jgi:two-component system cell cycle sensor histidine kinase/response regulator CckA